MSYFIAAYLLIWLLLMGYLFYLSRKQSKISKGIDFLKNLIREEERESEINTSFYDKTKSE